MLNALVPVLDRNRESFAVGIVKLPVTEEYAVTHGCPIVFGVEKPEAIERQYMASHYGGLNPYAFKIWEERINAFRVIARVDSFSLSVKQSEQITKREGVEILSPQERGSPIFLPWFDVLRDGECYKSESIYCSCSSRQR